MNHDPNVLARELEAAADPALGGTAEDLAKALALVPEEPSGIYICGCPWIGDVIPHYCPLHPGACVVYEIRGPRE